MEDWKWRLQDVLEKYSNNGIKNIEEYSEICEVVAQELSKAREEGAMNVFTKEEWFDLKLAMNDIFNSGNHAYEGISKKIQSELDKLSNKNKCSGK